MIRLAVALVTVSLGINLVASDQKEPSLQIFLHDDVCNIVEEYNGYNPYLFNEETTSLDAGSFIKDMCWHPDGIRVAAAYANSIKVWNIKSTAQPITLTTPSFLSLFDYSSTGQLASITMLGEVSLWAPDTDTKAPKASWSTKSDIVRFDPKGTCLLSATLPHPHPDELTRGSYYLWDTETQKEVSHSNYITSASDLAWLNDTTFLACEMPVSLGTIALYDTRTMKQIHAFPAQSSARQQQIAVIDETRIIFNNKNFLALYDPRNKKVAHPFKQDHKRAIELLSLCDDKHTVLVHNSEVGTNKKPLAIYDLTTQESTKLLTDIHPYTKALISPSGQAVVGYHSSEYALTLWKQKSLIKKRTL